MERMPAYRLRHASRLRNDVPSMYDVLKEGAAGLGGPMATEAIKNWITPSRLAVVLERIDDRRIVGVSLSRYPTTGLCYHCVFAVYKDVRGQGLGGAMIAGILRYLAVPGRHQAHKWFASYPSYNTDVDALYIATGWVHEGTLRHHTKNKTDLIVRAFHLPEMSIPAFWHETHPEAHVVDWRPLLTTRPAGDRQATILDTPEVRPDQGRDGDVW